MFGNMYHSRSVKKAPEPTRKEPLDISPFAKPDKFTDITFHVEGRNLHFCKALLKMASPVFERMFESEFKEKGATVIPLPGKTYEEVDIFLRLLHPMHCWKPIEDDHIGVVLRMADEYEMKPVQQRCQYQMETSLKPLLDEEKKRLDPYPSNKFDFEKILFYLRLSDEHNIQETRSTAIEILAKKGKVKMWEKTEAFLSLNERTQNDLVRARCRCLESNSMYR